jgi:sec-independent protein translocase protein TatC
MNSDFKFKNNLELTLELPFSEHIEELRQRSSQLFWFIFLLSCLAFIEVKDLVKILELPVTDVKFFQLSPSEYFLSTVKISFYTGLLFGSPILLSQVLLFLLPGLTKIEKKVVLPLLIGSLILFICGLLFSYYLLIPAALTFFFNYSNEVIEPLWSFTQYFEFILVLFYSTGIAFQIPIIQIVLGLLKIISVQQMLDAWKYVILGSTIIGAILTPSTDPFTQLLLSGAILILYFLGISFLIFINNF